MLTTQENIIDPIAFIEAEPALLNELEQATDLVIAGPDLDVRISRSVEHEPLKNGRVISEVSAILGNLYIAGEAFGHSIDGQTYNFEWYPSPEAVNTLSQKLGNTPGENVFRFAHADGATISAAKYVEHLARAEYPQSTGGGWQFGHDRDNDHAIATLLLPATAVKAIQQFAIDGDLPKRASYRVNRKNRSANIAGAFDDMTGMYNVYLKELWPKIAGDVDELTEDDIRVAFKRSDSWVTPELMGIPRQ